MTPSPTANPPQMHPSDQNSHAPLDWNLADIIDFEILVGKDKADLEHQRVSEDELSRRDRAIYKETFRDVKDPCRREVFRWWLEQRRPKVWPDWPKNESTSGQEVASILRALKWAGFIAMLLLGFSLVRKYFGDDDLKEVLWLWPLFILPPFLFTCFGFFVLFSKHSYKFPPFLRGAIRKLLSKFVSKPFDWFFSNQTGRTRSGATGNPTSLLGERMKSNAGVFGLVLSNVVHCMGLGLVFGITVALALYRAFDAKEFGCRSNTESPATWIRRSVGLIALPWRSFLGEGRGYPSGIQIAQSLRTPANEVAENPSLHIDLYSVKPDQIYDSTVELAHVFVPLLKIMPRDDIARMLKCVTGIQFEQVVGVYENLLRFPSKETVTKSWSHFLGDEPRIVWSRFMVLSSLFWGIFPRACLLWAGSFKIRLTLRGEAFDRSQYDSLWSRMRTATGGFMHPQADAPGDSAVDGAKPADAKAGVSQGPANLAFIPRLLDPADAQTVLQGALQRVVFDVGNILPLPGLPGERSAMIRKMKAENAEGQWNLALIREAAMPPIEELKLFIRELHDVFGIDASVHIILLGGKNDDHLHRLPVSKLHAEIWRKWCTSLLDKNLALVPNTLEAK